MSKGKYIDVQLCSDFLFVQYMSLFCATLRYVVEADQTDKLLFIFLSSQYNIEHRQREMEDEKREKLQQLIQKKKDEQSEYHMSCSSSYCNVFS